MTMRNDPVRVNRRRLLQHTIQAAGALWLTGCSAPNPYREHAESVPVPWPRPTLETKIGQMLMVGFRGQSVTPSSAIIRDIREQRIGSVVLFEYNTARNENARRQLQKLTTDLQAAAPLPLLIAIDEEGGRVTRLREAYGFPGSVSAAYLGGANDPRLTRHYANTTSRTLADVGVNLNLAPVVDLNVNPNNPVIGRVRRSFSDQPEIVVTHAGEFIRGHHSRGVFCTLKHFPGHGSSIGDTHRGFVDVTESWTHNELEPFRQLIDQGLADAIMTAHIFNAELDDTHPATLSRPILTDLLRGRLGYNGVIISDDMQMRAISDHYRFEEAVQLAVLAGVDIIAVGNNVRFARNMPQRAIAAIHELLAQGAIDERRIDASYDRIMALKSAMYSPAANVRPLTRYRYEP